MRQFALAILALVCVSSAAWAQGDFRADRDVQQSDNQYPVAETAGLQPFGRVVSNANDCAPGHPEAVWGAGASPVGYACTDSANGQ